jgi:hypothetical protein
MIWSSRYIKKTEFEWDNVKIEALVAFYSKADAGRVGLSRSTRKMVALAHKSPQGGVLEN